MYSSYGPVQDRDEQAADDCPRHSSSCGGPEQTGSSQVRFACSLCCDTAIVFPSQQHASKHPTTDFPYCVLAARCRPKAPRKKRVPRPPQEPSRQSSRLRGETAHTDATDLALFVINEACPRCGKVLLLLTLTMLSSANNAESFVVLCLAVLECCAKAEKCKAE